MNLSLPDPKIELTVRRCGDCNRWHAAEVSAIHRCGPCQHDRCGKLLAELQKLERSNAALRGAITRKARR